MTSTLVTTLDVPHFTLAFMGMPGGAEWIVVLVIGLLLFGRRLPEVGRGVGKSIVEFRKGIQGIEDEVDEAAKKPTRKSDSPAEQLPSAQNRSDVIQGDGRSVSQEAVSPISHSDETDQTRSA